MDFALMVLFVYFLIIYIRILLDEEILQEGWFVGSCLVYVYLVIYNLIYLAYHIPDSVDGFCSKSSLVSSAVSNAEH